jgi:hypothetical protein
MTVINEPYFFLEAFAPMNRFCLAVSFFPLTLPCFNIFFAFALDGPAADPRDRGLRLRAGALLFWGLRLCGILLSSKAALCHEHTKHW